MAWAPIYTFAAGLPAVPGPPGAAGTSYFQKGQDGATWLMGTTPPDQKIGNVGDFYFQTSQPGAGPILIPGPPGPPGISIMGPPGVGVNPGADLSVGMLSTNGAVTMLLLNGGVTVPGFLFVDGSGNVTAAGVSNNPFLANWTQGADITTTSSAQGDAGGFSFQIAASEVWSAEFNLYCSGSVTGMKFQLLGPGSPTNVLIFNQGDTTGVAVVSTDAQTAFGVPTQAYVTGAFSGLVVIRACIENGVNAGTIQLQFASTTNTQSNSIKRGSYMVARRVS